MSIFSNQTSKFLEATFDKYNCKRYIYTDPLRYLYEYDNIRDKEIIGLIASSLAYGNINQILKTISIVLDKIGYSPYEFVKYNSYRDMSSIFKNFKYRFTRGEDIVNLLFGIKRTLYKFGSLNNCFKDCFIKNCDNFLEALTCFANELVYNTFNSLLPNPDKKSACKRLNLFLRWMIRNDDVDTGSWVGIPTSVLIVPLDTHMHKIGLALRFTKRKQANFKTAIEITSGFRIFSPDDPVKYDFSLTRIGILKKKEISKF